MNRHLATVLSGLILAAVPAVVIAQLPKTALGVAFMTKNNKVTVAEIRPGGAGDRMGVRPGDVITHAAGRRINNQLKLSAYLSSLDVGDPVALTVKRSGKSLDLAGTAVAR